MFRPTDPLIRKLDSDEEEDAKPLKQVNEYVCVRALGRGSCAKAYLGVTGSRPFALKRFRLKELRRLDTGVSQLEREIAAMRKIRHPNIIRLHEVLHDDSNDIVYLVLDYADFGSLDQLPYPDTDVLRSIFPQILTAVAHLHSHGIVHQDIKPSNILLAADGRAFLSDFGVGHSFQSTAMVVGSPAYQAPEALADEDADDASPALEDVWSLGVTLYQSLFLRLPFEGETVFEIVHKIRSQPLDIPHRTDPKIAALLRGMLTVDPRKRMTIEEIRSADFFRDAKISPIGTPKGGEVIADGRKIMRIEAVLCDVNYSFARPCLKQDAMWSAFAPNWTCRFNNSVVRPAFVGDYDRAAKMRSFQ